MTPFLTLLNPFENMTSIAPTSPQHQQLRHINVINCEYDIFDISCCWQHGAFNSPLYSMMQLQDTVVMQCYEARLWAENDQSKHLGAQLSCASTWQEYLPLYGRTDFKILFLILTIVDVNLKKQGLRSQLCHLQYFYSIHTWNVFVLFLQDENRNRLLRQTTHFWWKGSW